MGKAQVPTTPVSARWILSDPAFERGARDARAGRGFPVDFDDWETNSAWNYERGRIWAQRAPRTVILKQDGRITAEAVGWFMRLSQDIL